jgi:anti-sigma B factor antagonist
MYLIQDHPSHGSIDNFPGPDIVDIGIASANGVAVVTVIGELDVSNSQWFADCLHQAIDGGARELVVDIEHLTSMDSTGVSVLASAHTRLVAIGGTLIVLSPLPAIRRLFAAAYLVSTCDSDGAA